MESVTDARAVSPRPNSTTADPNFALPTLGSIAHGRFRQVQFRGARGGNVGLPYFCEEAAENGFKTSRRNTRLISNRERGLRAFRRCQERL